MIVGQPSADGVALVSLRADEAKFDEKQALDALNKSWPGSKLLR